MSSSRRMVAVLTSALALSVLLPSPVLAGTSDLLPDLEMAPLSFGIELRTSDNGRKHLRFGTVVYNVGDGPLEVRARNASNGVMHRVVQAIKQTDGSWRKVLKPDARVFYAGDGHDHWHVARFNRATLTALAATPPTDGRLRKIGFCLVDSFAMSGPPPGAAPRTYLGCGVRTTTSVKMGISRYWGDLYAPDTKFQEIDVTGLPAGQYRLCTTTNPRGLWKEKDDNTANNYAWMDIELNVATSHFEPIGSGQTAC